MVAIRRTSLPLLFLALALSGCMNGPDGQSAAKDGNLAYNGASNGTHSSSFEAEGTCSLHISSNIGSGRVDVVLRTPSGTTVEGSAAGPGQKDVHAGDATGGQGTWTLTATRSGSGFATFSGQYLARADC